MLAIRMQRVGRKGYAEYRMVVQDSRLTPTSGRVVAKVGHHNPHTKATVIDKEKLEYYLKNGAQPSDRVVRLLISEKVALPDWVKVPRNDIKREIKNPDKLRRNQPAEEKPEIVAEEAEVSETLVEEAVTEEVADEPTVEVAETAVEEPVVETENQTETAQATETITEPEAETTEVEEVTEIVAEEKPAQ